MPTTFKTIAKGQQTNNKAKLRKSIQKEVRLKKGVRNWWWRRRQQQKKLHSFVIIGNFKVATQLGSGIDTDFESLFVAILPKFLMT